MQRNTNIAMVRLTRKLAGAIDGIDLTQYQVGELISLPAHEAELLVAEGWAELIAEQWSRTPGSYEPAVAADRPPPTRTRRNKPRR